MERLHWVQRPSRSVVVDGDPIQVTLQLSDDMGRMIQPTADLGLLCRWDRVDNSEVVDAVIAAGMHCLDDPLMFLDDSVKGDSTENDDAGRVTLSIPPPSSLERPQQVTLVVEVKPPMEPYPPLPWEVAFPECAGGRWSMGTPTAILPCCARVSLSCTKDDTPGHSRLPAEAFRTFSFGDSVNVLTVFEDLEHSGHGKTQTHGTVWDCGIMLSAFLTTSAGQRLLSAATASNPEGEKHIGVDVGCGTAIVGMTLARLLPRIDVIATDIEEGLDIAKRNIVENKLQDRVTVQELFWGAQKEKDVLGNNTRASVVLASDVVYSEDTVIPLADTLEALCGPQTLCLLGFRNRTSSDTIAKFFGRLKDLGFETTAIDRNDLHPAYRATDAHVMHLSKA
eukprot:m.217800 g.217800  ORF g.217800 m.217800 type:complete len:394 (-) comp19140_c0_seq1:564-1745(-)